MCFVIKKQIYQLFLKEKDTWSLTSLSFRIFSPRILPYLLQIEPMQLVEEKNVDSVPIDEWLSQQILVG